MNELLIEDLQKNLARGRVIVLVARGCRLVLLVGRRWRVDRALDEGCRYE